MITPRFEVQQNETHIILILKVPHIKASEIDFYINTNEFKFYAKPYFLRLQFAKPLATEEDIAQEQIEGKIKSPEERAQEKAVYDYPSGTLTIHLPKKNPGEFFPDLDMLTRLLEKKKPETGANIQILGNPDEEDEDEEIDWEMEQKLPEVLSESVLSKKPRYGFDLKYSNYFEPLQEELFEIIDLKDPDRIPNIETDTTAAEINRRKTERMQHENSKFDEDYYMADFMDESQISGILEYECYWEKALRMKMEWKKKKSNFAFEPPASNTTAALNPASLLNYVQQQQQLPKTEEFVFGAPAEGNAAPKKDFKEKSEKQKFAEEILPWTEKEKETLIHLPNKEFIIDHEVTVFLGLLDILYSYAYNYRTTYGENSVESSWTVVKLSPTLCFLDVFSNVKETLVACMRRVLAYPLYRNWKLVNKVLADVVTILKLGKRAIMKCLLDTKHILDHSDSHFHLSRLYIDDYCVWLQKAGHAKIKSLCKEVEKTVITKEDMGWNLAELEAEAQSMEVDNSEYQ